ncbi:MAG: DNA polymerase III subunit beta [Selenomonas sp.]|jgi:DNA polymerase-3 subunit beta|uniref:DNA polymerase III subunit beta n=1 Tax=Selenomonas sp. AE3005 TaxID=1485543 RepID=UPI00048243F4|nr:DNA polymerase III subunit beta [Selenomonas sp. AE3005]MBQ1416597.1 DNA polymerase III subunit beta [Selenomonas sp.]MBQ4213517.1 DNA polymerase III subunit beta [Selenomonas sp.]
MKITCSKSEMVNALQIVTKAIASKPQTPILSGIFLRAENGILEMQATNNEIGLINKIPAEVEESGQIALGGRYLLEVIRKMPGDSLTLSYNRTEKIVNITSGQANFTLLSMNAAEFPTIKEIESTVDFTIKDNVLRSLIKKTVFACSKDESRPVFTGCSLEVADNKITMAATNMHRLAVKYEQLNDELGNIKVIIPSLILQELLHNMTSEIPSDVHVSCNFNQISFAFDNLYMTSRLIEGAFPDYNNVIPANHTTLVTLDSAEFNAAVDRVSLISRSGDYNVIKLEFANSQLVISSNNPDVGNAVETIPASIEGPDITIAFNAQYIIDVMKNIDSNKCELRLTQPLSPITIREEHYDAFIYVVTPVRTAH